MTSIFFPFLVVVDLAGVCFNIRMLLDYFKKTTNYSSCRLKLRPFIICQFVYQVTILATTTVEAWKGLEAQHEECCRILGTLSTSIKLLLGCNLTAIFFMSTPDYPSTVTSQQLTPKLLIPAALCMGFILSAVFWWNSCVLRESIVPQRVMFAIIFVSFLSLTLWKSAKDTKLDKDNENLKTPSLRDFATKHKTLTIATAWLLLCLVLMLASFALPWKSLEGSGRRSVFHLAVIIVNSVVGIVLPFTFTDLFRVNSKSAEEENEMKTITGISVI